MPAAEAGPRCEHDGRELGPAHGAVGRQVDRAGRFMQRSEHRLGSRRRPVGRSEVPVSADPRHFLPGRSIAGPSGGAVERPRGNPRRCILIDVEPGPGHDEPAHAVAIDAGPTARLIRALPDAAVIRVGQNISGQSVDDDAAALLVGSRRTDIDPNAGGRSVLCALLASCPTTACDPAVDPSFVPTDAFPPWFVVVPPAPADPLVPVLATESPPDPSLSCGISPGGSSSAFGGASAEQRASPATRSTTTVARETLLSSTSRSSSRRPTPDGCTLRYSGCPDRLFRFGQSSRAGSGR